MREKIISFLSSYGLITLGLCLLFLASVSVKTGHSPLLKFPVAGPRLEAQAGGDAVMTVAQLPESRPQPIMPLPKDNTEFAGQITAVSVLILDDKTDMVLYTKNSGEVRPLASITKLMSALVLMEMPIDWASSTIICEDDCDSGSHSINVGEEYTLDDLLHVALIGSSNTAIKALARMSGVSLENFVLLMNRKAQSLDLTSAKFVEPSGLDAGNIASAFDVAKILKETLKYKKIYETMKVGEYYAHPLNKDKARRVWSTNWLLTNWVPSDFQSGEIVGKTGFIGDSKYNFAVRIADKTGHAIRIVILGSESNESRFGEARDAAEWVFEHYLWPDQEGYEQLVE
mgnify:CR=1 FL=1